MKSTNNPNNRVRNGFINENPNEFFDAKVERASELLTDILMVTSGCFAPVKNNHDWGHKALIEVLEMFMICHDKFFILDFAERLQENVYQQSLAYSNSLREWKDNALAEQGLDDEGEPMPTKSEEKILDLSGQPTTNGECIDLAQSLSSVLNNPLTPSKLKIVISDELTGMDEAGHLANVIDSPEYIAKVLSDNFEE